MNTRAIGTAYEDLAAQQLTGMGYRILERNFRCREGEIDLIAIDGAYLVFVEVRYRKDDRKGHPLESVTPYKQRKICRVSEVYRYKQRIPLETPVRYDVAAVLGDKITIVKNAFAYHR